MKNLLLRPSLILLGCLTLFSGCQKNISQADLLQGIGSEIITSLYEGAAADAAQLAQTAQVFETSPTPENLETLRANWKKATLAWQRTEPFRLGPATDLWLSNKIGYQNIRPATIDAIVAKMGTAEEVKVSAVGASAKGFFALQYLLFTPNGDPRTPSAQERRYLLATSLDAAELTRQLADAWSPTGKNYSQNFAGGGLPTLSKLVNGMIESVERLKEKRIARLLGREALWGDDSDAPAKKEFARAQDGEILAAPLEGIIILLTTPSSTGEKNNLFLTYLGQTGSKVGPDFLSQTQKCLQLTQDLPLPLTAASSRPALENDYAEIKKWVALAKSSLISALGVTLTFNSNDGD